MEKTKRYSKKREAILQALRASDRHPSAETLYQTLSPVYPDLSLATVYRNLALFKDEGLAVSVARTDGQERFDGRVSPHAHLICQGCGAVVDFLQVDQKALSSLVAEAAWQGGVQVARSELTCYGLCPSCSRKKSEPQK
ncbi:MAG: transcriptional repressor [Oscillospiraceae bacterium]|nr:transcriptional repressor [Oscillospiraceae bacterium]